MSTQAYRSTQTLMPRVRTGQQGWLREPPAATPLAIFVALRAARR